MPSLAEFRQNYPQYNDMSDADLSDAIHKKWYSDMPRGEFDQRMGTKTAARGFADFLISAVKGTPFGAPLNVLPDETIKKSVSNIPSSAAGFAKDIVQPVLHPIETAENLGQLGKGVLQKLGVVSGTDAEKYADAVGKFLKDRYGSVDAVRKTLENDPVGLAADVSMVLSGGGTATARLPGAAGRVGRIAAEAGAALDPLRPVAAAAKPIGKVAAAVIGDVGTHTGRESVEAAFQAGREGGAKGQAFQQQLRGQAPLREAVDEARQAVGNIRQERGRLYRDEMAKMGGGRPLNFDKVDEALVNITKVGTFKGQVLDASTQAIREKIAQTVQEWRMLDPLEYHTAEGLDALKRKIGMEILDRTEFGTPERKIAGEAYDAVRKTIIAERPEYGKIMEAYEQASEQIKEIDKTLSTNPNASVDTALRKLQSVLRNNVNSNFGRRRELAEFLVNAGAPHLMEKLAGQALSAWTPRGLGKVVGAEILGWFTGTPGLGVATLPFLSPRIVGEGAYYAGKASKAPILPTARGAFQAGRLDDILEQMPASQPQSTLERRSSLDEGRVASDVDERPVAGQRVATM